MNFSPRRQQRPDVNLTPLIDVVFLLLIFFMVSTTFKQQSQLQIELPEAGTEPAQETEQEVLEITIDSEGLFYVNQEQVISQRLKTLKRAIRGAINDREDVPVVIKADAQTPHQAVITAMDAASQLGLIRITFATTRLPEEQ